MPGEISIANRKGHAVNGTFVDDATSAFMKRDVHSFWRREAIAASSRHMKKCCSE